MSKFRNYFLLGMILFFLLVSWLFIMHPDRIPPLPVVGLIYASALIYGASVLIAIRMNTKSLFLFILLFQISCSLLLRAYFLIITGDELGFTDNIMDSGNYRDIALGASKLTFPQTLELLEDGYSFDISDYGFPAILRIAYIIGGVKYGNLIMLILNSVIHFLSTVFLYKTALNFLEKDYSKIIAILWGFNLISIWLNVSGLKETIFLFLIIYAMYSLYRFIKTRTIGNMALFLAAAGLIVFFRIYLAIFFVLIFLLLFLPKSLYKKAMPFIWLGIIVIIINFIAIFSYFFPILQYINEMRESVNPFSGLTDTLSFILPLLGPFPYFLVNLGETANFNTFVFPAFLFAKVMLSVFGIYGIYKIVVAKKAELYPMVTFFILNTLLTIITGFQLHYRFLYCALPFFIAILVYGFYRYCESQKASLKITMLSYMLIATLMVYLYNTK